MEVVQSRLGRTCHCHFRVVDEAWALRTLIQQMIEARPRKQKGETMKYVTKIVNECRKRILEQQQKVEQQQLQFARCFEHAKLDEF